MNAVRRLRVVDDRREATSADLAAWTEELRDSYLLCRDLGHLWKPHRAWLISGTRSLYARVMRCPRCKTERHQELSPSGHVTTGHYVYPEGYLAPRGAGVAVNRDHLRLVSVRRLIEES